MKNFISSLCTVWLLVSAFAVSSFAETKNVLLIGFWPPTNEMLREFSHSPTQNPAGWQGKNWKGLGYDIYAYFPEYPSSDKVGVGDFRVDFASVYNDFQKYTALLHPVAILGFGHGAGPWEIETNFPPYFKTWFQSGKLPSEVGVKVQYPIPDSLKLDQERHASLPFDEIAMAVNAIPDQPLKAWVDSYGNASNYLCGFLGYLIGWYHDEHSAATDPARVRAGGFIHVNGSSESGTLATEATLSVLLPTLSK